MQPKLNIRMKDIAKAARCSVMTVSLALRNSSEVSNATRDRIHSLAKSLGYTPNPLVSALMTHRMQPHRDGAGVIAVLTKFNTSDGEWKRSDNFYSQLWNGMEERASELGFRLDEFPVPDAEYSTGKRLTRILTSRGIRGIILFPGGGEKRKFPELNWNSFATVGTAFESLHMPIHRIASDHLLAMETALGQLSLHGYKRPGLAMYPESDIRIRCSMTGRFLAWQQNVPPSQRVPLIPKNNNSTERDAFEKWFRKHRPDVVLSLQSWHYDTLQKIGASIPAKTGFIHLAKRDRRNISCVDLQTRNVGRTSIDILARELYFNHTGFPKTPELILVSGAWDEGDTLHQKSVIR